MVASIVQHHEVKQCLQTSVLNNLGYSITANTLQPEGDKKHWILSPRRLQVPGSMDYLTPQMGRFSFSKLQETHAKMKILETLKTSFPINRNESIQKSDTRIHIQRGMLKMTGISNLYQPLESSYRFQENLGNNTLSAREENQQAL